uniref:Uncharacterized protein n=1 Tax=Glossina brevipalpis TaxID=37001 RepID=A0A1A9X5N4_9MUSC
MVNMKTIWKHFSLFNTFFEGLFLTTIGSVKRLVLFLSHFMSRMSNLYESAGSFDIARDNNNDDDDGRLLKEASQSFEYEVINSDPLCPVKMSLMILIDKHFDSYPEPFV